MTQVAAVSAGTLLGIALWCWPPLSAAQVTPQRASDLIESAMRAHRNGDTAEGLRLVRTPASAGNRDARFAMGLLLESGAKPTYAEYREAAHWYLAAAHAGHPGAMNNLAAQHVDGRGVPVTLSIARHWYESAANAGFAPAQYNLALMYGRGKGVPRDDARMLELLERAAAIGFDRAQAQLGRLYLDGTGVKADSAKAAAWFHKAAEQGHAEAQYHLGMLYKHGAGVVANRNTARQWLARAAEQGHALGTRELREFAQSPVSGEPDNKTADAKTKGSGF